MFGQAASFAFLAAVSPTALLVMAVYLGSATPRRIAGLYLAGALLMSAVMALALLIIVRSAGLDLPTQRTPRYGVRLGLGILALAAAAFMARRRAASPLPGAGQTAPAKKRSGLMSRLVTAPTPGMAFLAGVLLFAPSLTFIAAVQVVATARAGVVTTAAALIVVVVISAAIVWLPLLTYLFYPAQTTRRLKAVNGWLRTHGRQIMVLALAVGGVLLVLNGALGITG
jgi:hypothetical protein